MFKRTTVEGYVEDCQAFRALWEQWMQQKRMASVTGYRLVTASDRVLQKVVFAALSGLEQSYGDTPEGDINFALKEFKDAHPNVKSDADFTEADADEFNNKVWTVLHPVLLRRSIRYVMNQVAGVSEDMAENLAANAINTFIDSRDRKGMTPLRNVVKYNGTYVDAKTGEIKPCSPLTYMWVACRGILRDHIDRLRKQLASGTVSLDEQLSGGKGGDSAATRGDVTGEPGSYDTSGRWIPHTEKMQEPETPAQKLQILSSLVTSAMSHLQKEKAALAAGKSSRSAKDVKKLEDVINGVIVAAKKNLAAAYQQVNQWQRASLSDLENLVPNGSNLSDDELEDLRAERLDAAITNFDQIFDEIQTPLQQDFLINWAADDDTSSNAAKAPGGTLEEKAIALRDWVSRAQEQLRAETTECNAGKPSRSREEMQRSQAGLTKDVIEPAKKLAEYYQGVKTWQTLSAADIRAKMPDQRLSPTDIEETRKDAIERDTLGFNTIYEKIYSALSSQFPTALSAAPVNGTAVQSDADIAGDVPSTGLATPVIPPAAKPQATPATVGETLNINDNGVLQLMLLKNRMEDAQKLVPYIFASTAYPGTTHAPNDEYKKRSSFLYQLIKVFLGKNVQLQDGSTEFRGITSPQDLDCIMSDDPKVRAKASRGAHMARAVIESMLEVQSTCQAVEWWARHTPDTNKDMFRTLADDSPVANMEKRKLFEKIMRKKFTTDPTLKPYAADLDDPNGLFEFLRESGKGSADNAWQYKRHDNALLGALRIAAYEKAKKDVAGDKPWSDLDVTAEYAIVDNVYDTLYRDKPRKFIGIGGPNKDFLNPLRQQVSEDVIKELMVQEISNLVVSKRTAKETQAAKAAYLEAVKKTKADYARAVSKAKKLGLPIPEMEIVPEPITTLNKGPWLVTTDNHPEGAFKRGRVEAPINMNNVEEEIRARGMDTANELQTLQSPEVSQAPMQVAASRNKILNSMVRMAQSAASELWDEAEGYAFTLARMMCNV